MKMIWKHLIDWKLDDLLDLEDPPFTDDIKPLPFHFKISHQELLYNDGKESDRNLKRFYFGWNQTTGGRAKIHPQRTLPLIKCPLLSLFLLLVKSLHMCLLMSICYGAKHSSNLIIPKRHCMLLRCNYGAFSSGADSLFDPRAWF